MKVYIVDDTAFIRILCRYHLTNAGFEVVGETYDGAEAIQQIIALQPDCVIVDMALPSKNGVEVIHEVQAKFPHIQFIILSALDEDAIAYTNNSISYHRYIAKPFEGSDLVAAVREVEVKAKKDLHG